MLQLNLIVSDCVALNKIHSITEWKLENSPLVFAAHEGAFHNVAIKLLLSTGNIECNQICWW
jgi:hypothetical protein